MGWQAADATWNQHAMGMFSDHSTLAMLRPTDEDMHEAVTKWQDSEQRAPAAAATESASSRARAGGYGRRSRSRDRNLHQLLTPPSPDDESEGAPPRHDDSESGASDGELSWPGVRFFTNHEHLSPSTGTCMFCSRHTSLVTVKKQSGCVKCWRTHFGLPTTRRRSTDS